MSRDGTKQRAVCEFRYATDAWNIERRLVTRLEFGAQGANPRFIVTHLSLPADELYAGLFCQRGEALNRIKETQLDLFGTHASSQKRLANWLRIPILFVSQAPSQGQIDRSIRGPVKYPG
ncbi:transposase [Sulfuricystis multivorans]|uniref:transposase n=1 Tax=Sulfuricystis multivorans TaxID=2211108 RepID=UPI001558CA39